jgi:hypothetical protein
METPKTAAGRITEEIMTIFWFKPKSIELSTEQYNRVWSHVLDVLRKHLEPVT